MNESKVWGYMSGADLENCISNGIFSIFFQNISNMRGIFFTNYLFKISTFFNGRNKYFTIYHKSQPVSFLNKEEIEILSKILCKQ